MAKKTLNTMLWLLFATFVTHFQRRMLSHLSSREQKAHVQALLQLDVSQHDWFETR